MRIEQLKCFLEVARTGSITGAAQNLYVSQQSASQSIKLLEQELDCELLVRGKHGVSLTPYGVEVAKTASKIIGEQESLLHKLENMKASQIDDSDQMFNLVATSSISTIVLPRIISNFDSRSKRMDIKLSMCDNVDEVFETVQNGNYDIGLITFHQDELIRKVEATHHIMALDILTKDEIVAVMDIKHYKGHGEYISIAEQQQYRITQYNLVPSEACIMHSDDVEFHRNMLEIGALVMMPKLAYEYFFKSKRFIALPMEGAESPLIHAAIYKKESNKHLKEFVSMIRREMHAM